jgi:hypothetical protein
MADYNHNSIQAHSQPQKEHIIFSVYSKDRGESYNQSFHDQACIRMDMAGISYAEASGRYKGVDEKSFIVSIDHLDFVVELANRCTQETLLLLKPTDGHGLRPAILMYLQDFNRLEPIGWLKSVPEKRAKSKDTYLYRPDMDKYFITVTDRNKEVFI